MKTPRPYQDAADKSLFQYLFGDNPGHPLVVAPVASGKSLMIAELIKKVHSLYPHTKIVMLTHVKELLIQNAEELLGQYPGVDMGFYCAGLGQKKMHNDVVFASIQSIHSKVYNFNKVPEIIIIDECHLVSHRSMTLYRKFIDAVLALNPNCKVIGYTGTPFRADTGRLDEGEGKIFDDIAYEIGMDYMIEQGYWARPVCPELAAKMDVSGVKVVGGDYVEKQLQEAINKDEVTDPCIKELIEKGAGRNKWLVFTAGIEHAEEVTRKLVEAGITAEYIHSKRPSKENDEILARHRAGGFTALINVAKLTTGYNDPYIDLLVFMRPTRSPVLYVQMTGRGVRTVYADGYDLDSQQGRLDAIANSVKPDCMILDFGGVVAALGPIDHVSIKKSFKEKDPDAEPGEAIMKFCPGCGVECAAAQRYCLECGYCFINLHEEAANKAVMSRDEPPEWVDVTEVYYDVHRKENAPSSMKVTYFTMRGVVRDWICFEHHCFEPGNNKRYAWDQAVIWHDVRSQDQVPDTAQGGVDMNYKKPKKIEIRKKGKYYDVLDYEFAEPTPIIITEDVFEIPF